MPRYITLLQFTDKGARELQSSTARAKSFADAASKAGVKIEGQYWTLGGYDGVLILSAENEAKALHCLLELASQGAVRTKTLTAFTESEFTTVLGK